MIKASSVICHSPPTPGARPSPSPTPLYLSPARLALLSDQMQTPTSFSNLCVHLKPCRGFEITTPTPLRQPMLCDQTRPFIRGNSTPAMLAREDADLDPQSYKRLKKYTYANFFISSISAALATFSSLKRTHDAACSSGNCLRTKAT